MFLFIPIIFFVIFVIIAIILTKIFMKNIKQGNGMEEILKNDFDNEEDVEDSEDETKPNQIKCKNCGSIIKEGRSILVRSFFNSSTDDISYSTVDIYRNGREYNVTVVLSEYKGE